MDPTLDPTIVRLGGIPPFVSVVRHSRFPECRESAAEALVNIAASERNHSRIVDVGGVHALVELAESGQQFAKNRVAAALLNMVIPKTTHGAIVAGAGVPLLVALVNEVQENEALRQIWASTKGDAAGALMHLAANPDAQAVVREAGGIEAMVALLENREHMERATGKSGWMWNR